MPAEPLRKSTSATRSKGSAEPRLSRTRRSDALPVADRQAALRRQFGREQRFGLINLGGEPVFSLFRVDNPDSGTHYRVTIRGQAPGQNQCSCWDYATNHLGTCKHIEFTLARLQARRGGKAALARGLAPAHSEIRLDYLGMLGVLSFRKSLFAGVLDGGASEVFLQGTRLSSFMKSVEQVIAAMGADEGAEASGQGGDGAAPTGARLETSLHEALQSEAPFASATAPETAPADAPARSDGAAAAGGGGVGGLADDSTAADPWADLLQAGAALLQGLAAQRRPGAAALIRIERDPESGQPSLRIPMPDPALLRRLSQALRPWLER